MLNADNKKDKVGFIKLINKNKVGFIKLINTD
jgi:hypothetical protein